MKRKFLAWLLTIAMVFNMAMPYAAFADDLSIDTDSSYSADEFGATNNDDDATDVGGDSTVDEPTGDGEQGDTQGDEPQGDEPAAEADDNAESDGKEGAEEPAGTDEPAVDETPADEPADEPAVDETPADEPIDEPVVDETPVDEPVDEPAVDETPVDEPKADEQPAADVVAGLLGNFAEQALQDGLMPVAETGTVNLTLKVDGGIIMSDVGTLKLYTYDEASGTKGTDDLLGEKAKGIYTVALTPGTYWLEGYHFNTKGLLGGTSIKVGSEPLEYVVRYIKDIKVKNDGWVAGTDYTFSVKSTSPSGEERVAEPVLATTGDVANTAGTYSCLLLYGDTVTGTFTAIDKNVKESTITSTITPDTDQYSYTGISATFVVLHNLTVSAPVGSTISAGLMVNYMIYEFVDATTQTSDDDGVSASFVMREALGNNIWNGLLESHFVRVQHPDGVTYWTGGKWNSDSTITVTADDLQIGSSEWSKDRVVDDFSVSVHDVGNMYLVANAECFWQMAVGESKELNVHRNWQAVDGYWPSLTALPDMHYQVVDVNGKASDVLTVEPTSKYNDSQVNIKANKAGTAIVLITYDAVRHTNAYAGDGSSITTKDLTFSATWPEFTGVLVVDVGASGSVTTNMTLDHPKTDTTAAIDGELDMLFYTGDAGATYTFKPEAGCTVSVARSTINDGKMSFNGFEEVTADSDGSFSISGLKDGRHIIKVEKSGKAAYQVVTARKVNYTVYHADGVTPVTAENPAQPAEQVKVQFSRLVNPAERLSGAYNFTAAVYLQDADGNGYQSKDVVPGSTYGSYEFSGNASYQRLTVTIPRYIADTSYELSGSLYVGGFGSNPGGHRNDWLKFGAVRENHHNGGGGGEISVIDSVSIPVQPGKMQERTLTLQDDVTGNAITDTSKLTIKLTDADGVEIKLKDGKFTVPAGTYNYDISGIGVARLVGSIVVDDETQAYTVKVTATGETAWGGNVAGVEPKLVDGVYQIGTGDELAWFSALQNTGTTALSGKLTADINLANYDWNNTNASIWPSVATVFDGDGHTISGLNSSVALFAVAGPNSKITNLTVEGTACVAGFVGNATGAVEFENCINKVNIKAKAANVAGIIGASTAGNLTIKNCANYGNIEYQAGSSFVVNYIGGLIGQATKGVQIENCLNKGNIVGNVGSGSCAGGIVGYIYNYMGGVNNKITACANFGDVTISSYAGGIVGQCFAKCEMTDCYNTGKVTVSAAGNWGGGLAGSWGGYGSWGTADNTSPAIAKNCYSTGESNDKALFGEVGGWTNSTNSFAENCVYLQGLAADAKGTELTADELKEWTPINSAIKPVCGGDRYPALSWEKDVTFHTVGSTGQAVAATCTTDGYTEYTCATCTKAYKDSFVAALGHSWCTDDGTGDCEHCVYTAPTCTDGGILVRTCQRDGCEQTQVTNYKALGHEYCTHGVDSTCEHCSYTATADCTNDGVLARVCMHDNCEESKTATVPALGHMIKEEGKEEHAAYTIADCGREGCDVKAYKFWKSPYFEHMTLPANEDKISGLAMNTEEVGWVWNADRECYENNSVYNKVTFTFTLVDTTGELSFDFGCRQKYGFYDIGVMTLSKGNEVLLSNSIDAWNFSTNAGTHYSETLAAGTYNLSFELKQNGGKDPDGFIYFKNVTLVAHDKALNLDDLASAKEVISKIDAIDKTVTLDSERGIVSAREAYDALTDAQKELVTNLATLTAAEAALQALKDAAAAPVSITVYVSYFDKGEFVNGDDEAKTLLYKAPVSLDGTASTVFTMDDAFKAFHKKYYSGGESGYTGGGWVSQFWGVQSAVVSYGINNGWVSGTQAQLADSDTLVVYQYKDGTTYSDLLTWFAKDSYAVTAGADTAFVLNGLSLMNSGDMGTASAKPQGASIKVYDADGKELSDMAAVTDENGGFKLNFAYNGTYTVVASGTCTYTMSSGYNAGSTITDAPVVPARCTVTVTGGTDAPAAAATPVFITDLSADKVQYAKGSVARALAVAATVSDNGTLSYQWQQSANGTDWQNIAEANSASYTPATDSVGTVYYRCVVTNTLGQSSKAANSTAAQVEVYDDGTTTTGAVTISGSLTAGQTLTAEDTFAVEGERSYAWYKLDDQGAETLIENATAKIYTLTAAEVGCKIKVVVTVAEASAQGSCTTEAAVEAEKTVNVSFVISPADANVLVMSADGKVLGSGSKEVKLAQNSSFTYYVGKDGYVPVKGQITTAEADVTQTVTLAAKKLPGFSSSEAYNMQIGTVKDYFPTNTDEAVLKWCVPMGTNYNYGEPTNPVMIGEWLYMAGNVKDEDGNAYYIKKIDPATGSVVKKVALQSPTNYTYNYFLTTSEDMLFIMARTKVEAYDADLNRLWVSDAMPGSQGLCPINYSDGFVYGGTCMSDKSVFFCLSAVDGSVIWQNKPDVGSKSNTGHYWAGGCIVGDYVIYGADGGRIYAADKYTGEITSTVDVESGKNIRSSVAYDKGKIYFTSVDGYVHSADFDQASGKLSNHKSAVVGIAAESGGFGGTTTATPAVYNNRLYVGSSSYFAVFDATTLENIYRTEQKHSTLRDMRLVVDEANSCVYAFTTYYKSPGGLVMYTDKFDQTEASAEQDFSIFMAEETKQYGASMPIFGADGTIYASNDKGYLSAYIKPTAYLTGLKANVGSFTAEFDKKDLQQELVVPMGTTDVTLTLEATEGASIEVDGKALTDGTCKVTLADDAATVSIVVAKDGGKLNYILSVRAIHSDAGISVATSTSNNIESSTQTVAAYEGKNNVYVVCGATEDTRIWLAPTDSKATISQPEIISGTSKFYNVSSQNVYGGIAYPWRTYHSEPEYPLMISAVVTAENGTTQTYYVLALTDSAYKGDVAYKLGVSLNKTTLDLKKGAEEVLVADVGYLGEAPAVTWTSDDETVATVDANGKVTAKAVGSTVIKAAIADDMFASCTVNVTASSSGGGSGTTVDKTVPVYVTYSEKGQVAEGKDGTLLYKVPIKARDMDGDNSITMADAFMVLHELYYEDGLDGIDVEASGWIASFWGDSSAMYCYTRNHKWTDVAGSIKVSKNDVLDVYLLEDISEYSDLLTWFDSDSVTAKTGVEKTFTVNGANIFKSTASDTAKAKPAGASVTVYNDAGKEVLTTATDSNGQFKLTFADAGQYTIWVDGTCSYSVDSEYGAGDYSNAVVVPCRCTVSVSGKSTGGTIDGSSATTDEGKTEQKTDDKTTDATSDLPFADVKAGAWYYDAIKVMYDKGLMNGESATQFMPNNKLSRAMLVTILYRLAEQPEVTATANFADVAAGQWYTKAVAWASSNNIVSGVGDGKFAPNDSITRQELAAMLYRYASAAGLNTTATANLSSFTDGASVAAWAESAMQWAVGSGLIKGDENGALNPTGTATRAEVATVIVRLLEMSAK